MGIDTGRRFWIEVTTRNFLLSDFSPATDISSVLLLVGSCGLFTLYRRPLARRANRFCWFWQRRGLHGSLFQSVSFIYFSFQSWASLMHARFTFSCASFLFSSVRLRAKTKRYRIK